MQNLIVIPSIDIKHGKTVRVVQGIPELNCEEYGDNPVDMARIWRAENAKLIHIVDFDGAHDHSRRNFEVVHEICSSVVIPVEFAGGIRTYEDAQLIMQTGIARLAVNTMTIENKAEFVKVFEKYGPQKVVVSLDIQNDNLFIRGRSTDSGISCFDFVKEMVEIGINRFLVCDIARNGMLEGPNIELSKKIAEISGAKVTHAGGIRNKDELADFQRLVSSGVDSVIIGRALYENRFPCQKLWRVAETGLFN